MKQNTHRPFRFSPKLILPFLILLAFLTVTILVASISWEITYEKMDQEQIHEIEYSSQELYDELIRQFSVLHGYSASFTQQDINNHADLLEKLQMCSEKTEFSLVCFAYPDGTLYRNDGAMVQVSHRYYFQHAIAGESVFEFLENNSIDTVSRMGMAVPVLIDQEIGGVLLGLYDLNTFQNIFERIFPDTTALTYLCDRSGNLLLGTEQSEAFLQQRGLSLSGGNVMNILENSVFSLGSSEEVRENMQKGQGGHIAYKYAGTRRHTTYLPLTDDWYLFSVLHESRIYEEVLDITGLFYAILTASSITILLVFVFLLVKERKHTLEEIEKNRKTRYMLEHDNLTGLLTESVFLERVNERLKTPMKEPHCLVYLDIYKFNLINEMFGYPKGNELLCAVAEELKKLADQYNGLSSRISGDTFILFIPHREEIIQKFRTKNYRETRIIPLELYLHFGIYVIQDTDMPVDQMVNNAHLAQKIVKGNYGDYIAYYNNTLKEQTLMEQDIITTMEQALEKREFTIYLQPQYNYQTHRVCGAEALIRWISKEKGFLSPGNFIPVFESNGFILRLDEYIWDEVCRLQRKWIDQGIDVLPISVNVSRADLLKGDIAEKLLSLVQKYDLTPELLNVEVTESAYMDNPQLLIRELNQLTDYGFTVEMDDFGSGYSSLHTLMEVPFQVLKTDLAFLTNTGDPSRKDRILDGIIRMAHDMGMTVIAEGVETKEQADYLLALNCTQMQGYYFSRPVPVEEFEKMVYSDNPRNPFAKGHDSYLDIDKSEI